MFKKTNYIGNIVAFNLEMPLYLLYTKKENCLVIIPDKASVTTIYT